MFRKHPRPEDPVPPPPPGSSPAPGQPAGGDRDKTAESFDDPGRRAEAAQRERDEAVERWKRALADFQNFQRRAIANEQEARRQGVTGVLQSVLPVLDHFDVALTTAAGSGSVEQVVQGMAAIRQELLKALETHGVRPINPSPDDPFDPNQHQAIQTRPAAPGEGISPGHVISTMQAGYALGDRVIRPAKVTVAAPPED